MSIELFLSTARCKRAGTPSCLDSMWGGTAGGVGGTEQTARHTELWALLRGDSGAKRTPRQVGGAGSHDAESFISLGQPAPAELPGAALAASAERTHRPVWARVGAYHEAFHLALHQEILDFEQYVSPNSAERAERTGLLNRLRSIVAEVFPSAEMRLFGSFATDLYLPTSDIDVCVMSSGLAAQDALQKLGAALRNRGFDRVQCIDNAKVPIVKCVDEPSGIHVDISFDVDNGPANVKLIKQYLANYPALRPLVLVLKCFLHQRKLNEVFSGGIGSYCLILVVMSHLQMYTSNFHRPNTKPSLGLLLIDFFQLYGKLFNYTSVGLAPRGRGAYFPKVTDCPRRVLLSVERWIQYAWLSGCRLCPVQDSRGHGQPSRPHMLCVEDPQDSGETAYLRISRGLEMP